MLMKRWISILVSCIMSVFLPQMDGIGTAGLQSLGKNLVTVIAPVFVLAEEELAKESLLSAEAEYENKRAAESVQKESTVQEQSTEKETMMDGTPENGSDGGSAENEGEADDLDPAEVQSKPDENSSLTDGKDPAELIESAVDADVSDNNLLEKLKDFDYLIQNYYVVDSSTTITSEDLDAEKLISADLSVDKSSDGPQILIYHTHSQEGYRDSAEGDADTSVVAVGERLAEILTGQYGYEVLHHTGEYDVGDRDHAYSNAAASIQQILEENPSIEVVIDLHRDSVPEDSRLVTTINGKQTAKIMFFNGLCRTASGGDLTRLQNPYLQDNLAFSLQMQLAAADTYPDFTRKIYLKGYRYNMHFCPKSLLVEVGAQNNTLEEAMNAMEPLAELLAKVLQ
jgi:stage II sporulation protein P